MTEISNEQMPNMPSAVSLHPVHTLWGQRATSSLQRPPRNEAERVSLAAMENMALNTLISFSLNLNHKYYLL